MGLHDTISRLRQFILNASELAEAQQETALGLLDQLAAGAIDPSRAQLQLHTSLFGQHNNIGAVNARDLVGGNKYEIVQYYIVQLAPESAPQLGLPPPASPPSAAPQVGRAQREKPNPFIAGPIVPAAQFYGREIERQALKARIGAITAQSISLVGLYRLGKSSLLAYVAERIAEFCPAPQSAVVAQINFTESRFRDAAGVNEGLRRAIRRATGVEPWGAQENNDTYALEDGLAALARQGRRTILLIDEFCAFDDRTQFYRWGADWRALAENPRLGLALVVASHRPLPKIYAEQSLGSPFGNIFTQQYLRLFEPSVCNRLLRAGFASNDEQPSSADEALIAELGGGWPFYTQLAASLLWAHSEHAAVRAEFAAQSHSHFAHLWKHLPADEQAALRNCAQGQALVPATQRALQDQGLLTLDGRVFSAAFAAYLRGC